MYCNGDWFEEEKKLIRDPNFKMIRVSCLRGLEVSSKFMGCETEWNCDVVQPKQFQTACGWFPRRGMLKSRETNSSLLPPWYLGGCWYKGENASSKVKTQGNTGRSPRRKKPFFWALPKWGGGPRCQNWFWNFWFLRRKQKWKSCPNCW